MNRSPLALLALFALPVPCAAQSYLWQQIPTNGSPGLLAEHAMVYDAARDQVLVFGGFQLGGGPVGNTWSFDGATWTLESTTGPSPRIRAGMCYDPLRQEVLLLGGSQGNNTNLFWRWNGTTWSSHGFQPITGGDASMTFDALRGVAVAFTSGKIYEWNGAGNWVYRPAATSPGTSRGAIAFDAARGNTVLFENGQTWTWDGVDWQQQSPAQSPPPRSYHQLTYETASGKVILFGGYDGTYLNDTWAWDGVNWTQQIGVGIPSARGFYGMAYDDVLGQVVMYGGAPQTTETWKKGVTVSAPASTSTFGQGCAGSAGVPDLHPVAGSLPWLGTTQLLDVDNLFPFVFWAPFGVMGLSDSSWFGVPLPLDLGAVGMPGCNLLVDALEIVPLVNVGGTARWSVPIPFAPNLVGSELFVQASVIDPFANSFGMVWSNGLKLALGAQ